MYQENVKLHSSVKMETIHSLHNLRGLGCLGCLGCLRYLRSLHSLEKIVNIGSLGWMDKLPPRELVGNFGNRRVVPGRKRSERNAKAN